MRCNCTNCATKKSVFGPKFVDEISHLARLIEVQQEIEGIAATVLPDLPTGWHHKRVEIRRQHRYIYIDIGGSGRYMIDNATGQIFGIKAYGVVNRKKAFGTVHTVNEWNWGGYWARPRVARRGEA